MATFPTISARMHRASAVGCSGSSVLNAFKEVILCLYVSSQPERRVDFNVSKFSDTYDTEFSTNHEEIENLIRRIHHKVKIDASDEKQKPILESIDDIMSEICKKLRDTGNVSKPYKVGSLYAGVAVGHPYEADILFEFNGASNLKERTKDIARIARNLSVTDFTICCVKENPSDIRLTFVHENNVGVHLNLIPCELLQTSSNELDGFAIKYISSLNNNLDSDKYPVHHATDRTHNTAYVEHGIFRSLAENVKTGYRVAKLLVQSQLVSNEQSVTMEDAKKSSLNMERLEQFTDYKLQQIFGYKPLIDRQILQVFLMQLLIKTHGTQLADQLTGSKLTICLLDMLYTAVNHVTAEGNTNPSITVHDPVLKDMKRKIKLTRNFPLLSIVNPALEVMSCSLVKHASICESALSFYPLTSDRPSKALCSVFKNIENWRLEAKDKVVDEFMQFYQKVGQLEFTGFCRGPSAIEMADAHDCLLEGCGQIYFESYAEERIVRFVSPASVEKYKCCKCHQMLRPPVKQTVCGHRLCSICFEELLQSSSTICPGQEVDEEEMCADLKDQESVMPDFGTDRDIKILLVYCYYEKYGCKEKPKFSKLDDHAEHCYYKPVMCPNSANGCTFRDIQSEIEAHAINCSFALKTCTYCNENVTTRIYKAHVTECMNKPKKCSYFNKGCNFQGNAEAVQEHENNPEVMTDHLRMVNDFVMKLNRSNENVQQAIMETRRELQEIESKLSKNKGFGETKLIQHLMKTAGRLAERLGRLETDLQSKAQTEMVARQAEKLTALQDVSKMHESRITSIEQNSRTSGISSSEEAKNKLRGLESTIGTHDVRLAEYDLRFQCMESAGYDGVLIWKIKDYQRRKLDAVNGRIASLYSQPFYTSRFGYKMCARIYLNGDGIGKGTHISFFFVVMRGDYDALLPWPFRQKVTLSLLDIDGGRKPISDTFRPDPTSASFRQPVGEMNVASGCPVFAAQSVVETRTYIKDDTIYLKISVDCSDLSAS